MKRYKQELLSNYLVVQLEGDRIPHVVPSNYDIEDHQDRTLCTLVLPSVAQQQVLSNDSLQKVCHICAAILDRQVGNISKPKRRVHMDESLLELDQTADQLGFAFE